MASIAQVIAAEAVDVMEKVAARPTNDLSTTAVEHAKPELQREIVKEVTAVVQHATNTEDHWWQKRSFWAAIISMLGVVAAPLAMEYFNIDIADPAMQEKIITGITTVAGLVTSYLAVRAGTAKKPLGQGGVP